MATLLRTLGYPLAKWSFAFHEKGQLQSVPRIDYGQVELEAVWSSSVGRDLLRFACWTSRGLLGIISFFTSLKWQLAIFTKWVLAFCDRSISHFWRLSFAIKAGCIGYFIFECHVKEMAGLYFGLHIWQDKAVRILLATHRYKPVGLWS